MKTLAVHLNYGSMNYSPPGTQHSPLALPLRVLDADGSLVAEGVTSLLRPAQFDVSESDGPLFVRLTWPSGHTQTKRVEIKEGASENISFDDSTISRNEWSSWAVPRLGENTSLAAAQTRPDVRIDKFDRVWLRMWTREETGWSCSDLQAPIATYRNDAAQQLDLALDQKCRLLQIGGARVPWKFVALPGGGACRVLMTPNESTDPRAEPLKILVTTFRCDAESLMEFLVRDSMRAASSLAAYHPLAQRLLFDKADDPISAVAAAYFLLRSGGWSRMPSQLLENLHVDFPWLADPPLIRSTVLLRSGLSSEADAERAVTMIEDCFKRGLPIFSEGIALLKEAASVLRASRAPVANRIPYEFIESLAASQAWAGAVLSFYGENPQSPSPKRITGPPTKARRAAIKASVLEAVRLASSTGKLSSAFTFLNQLK